MCSSNADTTALGVHARSHVHGSKLLEHKLGGVRNDDLCNFGLVLAWSALELVLLEGTKSMLANLFQCVTGSRINLRNRSHETTNLADVDTESI